MEALEKLKKAMEGNKKEKKPETKAGTGGSKKLREIMGQKNENDDDKKDAINIVTRESKQLGGSSKLHEAVDKQREIAIATVKKSGVYDNHAWLKFEFQFQHYVGLDGVKLVIAKFEEMWKKEKAAIESAAGGDAVMSESNWAKEPKLHCEGERYESKLVITKRAEIPAKDDKAAEKVVTKLEKIGYVKQIEYEVK
jgi:hypothetical protein